MNEKETKETIAKINKAKSWFFEKIKQTNHQPDSQKKGGGEGEKNQINKIRNENGKITTGNTNIKDRQRLPSATICQ